jgi:hypothetical protein
MPPARGVRGDSFGVEWGQGPADTRQAVQRIRVRIVGQLAVIVIYSDGEVTGPFISSPRRASHDQGIDRRTMTEQSVG